MNVKNKVFALVMSFVICFGTVSGSFCHDKERINNISPLFVDGGVISAPMLATVSALAVGTGIVLKNSDDIYDIGYAFYDYIKSHNEMTWEFVQNAFIAGHTLINDVVHVDSNFLDIVLGFFDSTFKDDSVNNDVNYLKGVGYLKKYSVRKSDVTKSYQYDTLGENISIKYNYENFIVYYNDTVVKSITAGFYNDVYSYATINVVDGLLCLELYSHPSLKVTRHMFNPSVAGELVNLPYSGGYDKTKVEDKKENGSVALPVPGDLNSLVGQTSDDFWTNDKDLVGSKPIVKPEVLNPSIGTTDDVFIQSGAVEDSPGVDAPGLDAPGIVFPPFGGGLDFSPITNGSFTEKFPFSLASDIKNIMSVFNVEPKAPKFTVPIVTEELEIDLTQFSLWASIIRFFVLIGFIISLINITRKVIG